MDEWVRVRTVFSGNINRAKSLCEIQEHLEKHYKALDTTDILRSAVVLAVSAFDYVVHEIFRVEILRRYRVGEEVKGVTIPFSLLLLEHKKRERALEDFVVEMNSYKSFVHPDRVADALRAFVEDPWSKMTEELGTDRKDERDNLLRIYRWRNRIAHEADINPAHAGVEAWPIDRGDVLRAVGDVERIGELALKLVGGVSDRW